ncbi:hypothetical protein PoB_003580900 [Plakobranchus ocellatus]|uniref:Uncharacterized protein n=1 Tax=Plakobranchus ocellatus TaxID=259542 RepID=A0AAV4AND1_9GAST|nr:hypothetical protein PoB_003580900 [Plakobranchus ocellatus]
MCVEMLFHSRSTKSSNIQQPERSQLANTDAKKRNTQISLFSNKNTAVLVCLFNFRLTELSQNAILDPYGLRVTATQSSGLREGGKKWSLLLLTLEIYSNCCPLGTERCPPSATAKNRNQLYLLLSESFCGDIHSTGAVSIVTNTYNSLIFVLFLYFSVFEIHGHFTFQEDLRVSDQTDFYTPLSVDRQLEWATPLLIWTPVTIRSRLTES